LLFSCRVQSGRARCERIGHGCADGDRESAADIPRLPELVRAGIFRAGAESELR